MANGLICLILVTLSLIVCVDGFFLNRTDPSGVEYVDGSYWVYRYYLVQLRPLVGQLHPNLRIWLNEVIGDELASTNGFTQMIDDANRYRLLRRLIRNRILRWIVLLAVLKVMSSLFVLVVLPNIYFMAMTMME